MPEGDTIFRTARALTRALAGRPITCFRSNYATLTRFNDDTPFIGQTVERIEPRGKWMLTYFSGGGILVTHLLMNGAWHIYRPGEPWQVAVQHMRIVIENSDYVAVGFHIPVAEMHTAQSLARDRRIPPPARDVLKREFDAEAAIDRIAACASEEIGNVLMNQRVIAGVGNIFKSEICFVNGVNPFALVSSLSRQQIDSLVRSAQQLLAANVLENSGNTIATWRAPIRSPTCRTQPGENTWVYGRAGSSCRQCGESIRSRPQGPDVRTTFWCPRCQPLP